MTDMNPAGFYNNMQLQASDLKAKELYKNIFQLILIFNNSILVKQHAISSST